MHSLLESLACITDYLLKSKAPRDLQHQQNTHIATVVVLADDVGKGRQGQQVENL